MSQYERTTATATTCNMYIYAEAHYCTSSLGLEPDFCHIAWCKAALERELVEDIIVHLDVCEGRCQGRGRARD